MREVNPFDYWESHSSAIAGLGGLERSPDPRYCFHTRYHEVREGRAQFVLKMSGVRASFGELSIRVHAWKPETDSNVSLVSGARMIFADDEGELTLPIRFAAQKGVLYALYGYFTEDSDLAAQTLKILIEEPEDSGQQYPEPPQSYLAIAMNTQAQEARPANALLHYGRTGVEQPVSQSCTRQQIGSLGLSRYESGEAIRYWHETICLQALHAYGATHSGLEGLVAGAVSPGYAQDLELTASLTRLEGGPPPRTSTHFFDFLLMPAMPGASETMDDARQRWENFEDWLARLKVGGLAAVGLHYRPDSDLISSSATLDAHVLTRNEIGQWALRLIGKGYSVAPMAFAPLSDLVRDSRGLAGFVMIIQRL